MADSRFGCNLFALGQLATPERNRKYEEAYAGLFNKEMNPKPAYEALDQLINHQWRTNLSAKTDEAGKAQFRGFHGKHTVRVTSAGRTQEFEIDLAAGSANRHELTWKP
ncbi:MAG: hypothetical protein ACOX1P_08400 [Thermoguttaceae bacterium]